MTTLATVRVAQSVADANGTPAPKGQNLLVSPNQSTVVGPAGSTPQDKVFRVTNVGTTSQVIHPQARQLATSVRDRTGSVDLGTSSPTFVDQFGSSVPYQQ